MTTQEEKVYPVHLYLFPFKMVYGGNNENTWPDHNLNKSSNMPMRPVAFGLKNLYIQSLLKYHYDTAKKNAEEYKDEASNFQEKAHTYFTGHGWHKRALAKGEEALKWANSGRIYSCLMILERPIFDYFYSNTIRQRDIDYIRYLSEMGSKDRQELSPCLQLLEKEIKPLRDRIHKTRSNATSSMSFVVDFIDIALSKSWHETADFIQFNFVSCSECGWLYYSQCLNVYGPGTISLICRRQDIDTSTSSEGSREYICHECWDDIPIEDFHLLSSNSSHIDFCCLVPFDPAEVSLPPEEAGPDDTKKPGSSNKRKKKKNKNKKKKTSDKDDNTKLSETQESLPTSTVKTAEEVKDTNTVNKNAELAMNASQSDKSKTKGCHPTKDTSNDVWVRFLEESGSVIALNEFMNRILGINDCNKPSDYDL